MRRRTPFHIALASCALAAALAIAGFGWSWSRFGLTDEALAARLEREVQQIVEVQTSAAESIARRVAGATALVADATSSRDALAPLFEFLQNVTNTGTAPAVAATVYAPGTTPGEYRVLAWSDGPGEQDLATERLAGSSALFVAPGHVGLRLVAVEPVRLDDRVVGVAVAETVLAPVDRTSDSLERRLDTRYGPVSVVAQYASTRHSADTHGFIVTGRTGVPLVEVNFEPEQLAARRLLFQRRVLAVALLPLLFGASVLAVQGIERNRRGAARPRMRWGRVLLHVLATMTIALALAGVAVLAELPPLAARMALLVGAVVCVIRGARTLWWHATRQRTPRGGTIRLALEHLGGGLVLAAALEIVARVLERWITLAVLDRGIFVLFPFSWAQTLSVGVVLLAETVPAWIAAAVLAALALRWHPMRSPARALGTALLWLLPTVALMGMTSSLAGRSGWMTPAIGAVAVGFGLFAGSLHRIYRRTTPSARLLLALLAGVVPLIVLYPLAAATAGRATRAVIERDYAPATAGHQQDLLAELRRAQQRVDQMPVLRELVSAMPTADSQAAYLVWNNTGLERSRVISDVELYGPDRQLVSRFAFNLPEYVYRTALQPYQGSTCGWGEIFGENTAFGAEERQMLHTETGICDADGRLLGGVVLHVASYDYQALPFVSSPSPYYEIVGAGESVNAQLPGVALAVYGWSGRPNFTSGPATWAVNPEWLERLYRTAEPFWTSVATDDAMYDVHFSQNRFGVYAIGVPRVTWLEHVTRMAEIVALVGAFFVLWQLGALAHAPLARQPDATLRRVFGEVRTSFYRKLFLSFVIVAVVPVLATAVVVGGYMTARFRADVEYEAATTVSVARRVFQELLASERTVQVQTEQYDDVMVWIRQVIDHDVNLFDGSQIVATSQRDLFDSGFLPERTPASAYRAIALERRPVAVTEDRIGSSGYIVAAAPVSAWGLNGVLTVPLAPRQRDMERELDTFNRRVLVGAVLVVLFAAAVGMSLAGRISHPVARLTRATRQIAAGRLDVRVETDSADELRRLVDDFNSMAATLEAQRTELARSHQLKAWNEMARQVAHEIKNPLTPVQLAAEHLQQVHEDRGRPLGTVLDRCVDTVLTQVRLLRQIASEFANFAGEPTRRPVTIDVPDLIRTIVEPYRVGIGERVVFEVDLPPGLPAVTADRTLVARAITNLVENAVQAMPSGGSLRITGEASGDRLTLTLVDTGVGMDEVALAHAFEPYFSTKTAGSGLGLANARRNIEREGGTVSIASAPGRGTTVTVTLRVAPVPDEGPASDSAPVR